MKKQLKFLFTVFLLLTVGTLAHVAHAATDSHVYAVYNDDDKSLTFIQTTEKPTLKTDNVSVKSTDGKTYTGRIFEADGSWKDLNSKIKTVNLTTKVKPLRTDNWFDGCTNLTSVKNAQRFDMSSNTDMSAMFRGCQKLTSLDVSNWDTSNVTNIHAMFDSCDNLASLDVSNWDTGNVTDMGSVFNTCQKLTSLDVSNWDTSKVTDMGAMFTFCSSLTNLDVSNWDTSKVTDMGIMFEGCSGLTNLDVSKWNISKVIVMSYMFWGCSSLTKLDVSKWDTSAVTSMGSMFNGCKTLTNLDVSKWDTSKVTDMNFMFNGCSRLVDLDVSKWDTSNVTDMNCMFQSCSALTSIPVSNWKTSNVTDMSSMFFECSSLTKLDVSEWNTSKVTDMRSMFYACKALTSISVRDWNTSQVTNMNGMFAKCSSLANLDVSKWNTSKVTDMRIMFESCSSLTNLDVSNLDTSKVTNSTDMFWDTPKLLSLTFGSKFNVDSTRTGLADDFNERDSNLYSKWVRTSDDTIKSSGDLMTMDAGKRVGTWTAKKMTATVDIVDSNTNKTLESGTFDNYKSIVDKWTSRGYTFGTSNVPASLDPYASSYKMTYKVYMDPAPHVYAVYNDGTLTFIQTRDTPTLKTDNISVKSTNGKTYTGRVYEADGSWKDIRDEIKTVDLTTKVKPSNTYGWFNRCTNLTSVKNARLFDMSNNVNMGDMFYDCKNLTSVDTSSWDTSKVKNMGYMFSGCSSLANLDVSKWDTSAVTNMHGMFSVCQKLTSLDVSNWNTSKVTDMDHMFSGCSGLTKLNVSNWNTDKVTDMSYMFYGCSSLDTLDVSNWNTSAVIDMSHMFRDCESLTKLNVSNWNTGKVTDMSYMFYSCSSLVNLDVSNWDVSAVTDMNTMFSGCYKLADLDVSKWNTSKVTDMSGMFINCKALTDLDVSKWNTSAVADMSSMFYGCSNITNLDVSNWDTSAVTDMMEMFSLCYKLANLDVSKWNTSNVTDMEIMFQSCDVLTKLDVSKWNTSKVTNMSYMFNNCSNLTNLDVSNWDTSKVTDMRDIFNNCERLTSIPVSNWNTSKVTNMYRMFNGCLSLAKLDVSNWDTSKVTDGDEMFDDTDKLMLFTLGSKFNINSTSTGLKDDFNKRDSSLYSKWVRTSDDMIKSSDDLMTMDASKRAGTWVAKKMVATVDIVDSYKNTTLESGTLGNYKSIVDKWAHRGYTEGTSNVPVHPYRHYLDLEPDPYAPSYKMFYKVYMNPNASTYSVSTTTPKGTYMFKDFEQVGTKTVNLTVTMSGGAYFTAEKMNDVMNHILSQIPTGWDKRSIESTVTDGYGKTTTAPAGGDTAVYTIEFAVDQNRVDKNYGEFTPVLPANSDSYDAISGSSVKITLPDVYKVTSLATRTAPSSTMSAQDTVYAFYKLAAVRTGNHSSLGDLAFTDGEAGHSRRLGYLSDGQSVIKHITAHMPIDWASINSTDSYKQYATNMSFKYVNNYDNPDMAVVDTDNHRFNTTWYKHNPIVFDDKTSDQQVPYGQVLVWHKRKYGSDLYIAPLYNEYKFLGDSDYLTAKAGYGLEYPYQVSQQFFDESASDVIDDNETVMSSSSTSSGPSGYATTSNLYDNTLIPDINREELRFHTTSKRVNYTQLLTPERIAELKLSPDIIKIVNELQSQYGSLFFPKEFQTLTNITARSKSLRNGFQVYADGDYNGERSDTSESNIANDIMLGNGQYDPDHRHVDYIKDNVKDGIYPLNINALIGDVIVNKNFKIQIYGSRMASKDRPNGEISINGTLSGATSDTTDKLKDRYGITDDQAKQLKDFLQN